ncbi:aspartate/glutamate racemase family protein, partial [Amycolatopsis sp. NPDC049252]|uniref:aspartate/glutamate racemase family protein n=1 Tax=Amycolatopsis sp. NPDC049252 TaxID=3363933 RepID=UPI00371035D5
MRIVVTNCNTTEGMTKEIEAGARAAASPGTEILARTPKWGPESAEGWLDSFLSAAAVLDLLRGLEEPFDAVVGGGGGGAGAPPPPARAGGPGGGHTPAAPPPARPRGGPAGR